MISFSLVVRSMSDDTLLVDAVVITATEMGLLSGTVTEQGSGIPIGDGIVRIVRLDTTPPSARDRPVAADGSFSEWLGVGRYALQARKVGFVSLDADVVDLTDSASIQLHLAEPAPFFVSDSILVVARSDTVRTTDVEVSNIGSGTLVMSYHTLPGMETTTRNNDQWLFLRGDPREEYEPDILTVEGRACTSDIALRITSAAPWVPGDGMKLIVGLRTGSDSDSGLEAAGIAADYKVEWNNTASLYQEYAGLWRYASSVDTESNGDTLTLHFPRQSLVLSSIPVLELAIRVEDQTEPDTLLVVDTVPDDGGTSPISFSLLSASWLAQTGSSVTVPAGQTATFPLSFDTRGLADGLYRADLILQGDFIGSILFPTILAVGDVSELPEEPFLGVPYPNPTNSSLSVQVILPCVSETKFVMADLAGRVVQSWSGGTALPGVPMTVSLEFDAFAPRGVYILKLETSCGSTAVRPFVRN
jgi:hypothetical protein